MKDKIITLRLAGKSYKEIVKILGCSSSTVHHHCNKAGLNNLGLTGKRVTSETRTCKHCGNTFIIKYRKTTRQYCSKKCSNESINRKILGSKNGLKSANSQQRRSKNEISFFNMCHKVFKNVTNNEPIFNGWDADIIIHDFKIAVLWNGLWHYKKITKSHSVKQVKNRDKIKIKEIIDAGYTPYIIKDVGRHNENFVIQEFNKLTRHIPSLS